VSAHMPAVETRHARPTSPYKGLAAFDDSELDEQLFFGREHERDVIAANVVASRLTVLYGPSGVGKSSIVRAGVARDLRALPEEPLVVICDTWSGAPATALAEAVAGAASIDQRSLSDTIEIATAEHYEIYLLLDQVEEYFVYHGSDPALGDALAELVTRPELPVHVLVAIREDALARLDTFKRRLPGLLANRLQLEHLSADAGREAIVGPVERFAVLAPGEPEVSVEPGLVDAVLAGVSTSALIGATRGRGRAATPRGQALVETPYLQVVMQRIWEVERTEGSDVLRLSTLERLGGPSQIVGEHLERALGTLTPAQQALAAQAFNHLVTPSGTKIAHGTGDLARWLGAPQAELEEVLGTLARARILRPVRTADSQPAYEIFHDVLADAVLAWRAAFEARAALARDRDATRRRRRRLLIIFAIAAIALAAMGVVTVYAISQRDQAQRNAAAAQSALGQAKKANAQVLAKTKAVNRSLVIQRNLTKRATTLLKRANTQTKIAQRKTELAHVATNKANRETAIANEQADKAEKATNAEKVSERYAQKQTALATSDDKKARQQRARADKANNRAQLETKRARTLEKKAEKARADALASARVEHSTASAYQSQTALASTPQTGLQLSVRAATLDPKLALVESTLRAALLATRERRILRAGDTHTHGASYSTNGALILSSGDAGARIFNAGSGAEVGKLATAKPVGRATFSPDGDTIVTPEQGQAELWDAASLVRRRAVFQEGSARAAFSADSQRLLTWGSKSAQVWATATGLQVSKRLQFPASVTAAAINPDGSRAAIATGATASVYDSAGSAPLFTLSEPSVVTDLDFSPTGDTIATAGGDGVARLWNSDGTPRCATAASDGQLTSLVFSHTGTSLLTTDVQGDTRIWSTQTCLAQTQLIGQLSRVVSADFSPDDQYVVTAGADRTARIFSLPDGTLQATLLGHTEALTSVAYSPDGTRVVTAAADGTSRVWDASIDRPVQSLGTQGPTASSVAVSPDGGSLASVGADGWLRLWSLTSRQPLSQLSVGVPLEDVAFSTDGKLVAAAGADGTTRVWKTGTLAPVTQFSQTGPVRALALSPDGRWLATAGVDDVARVFPMKGGAPITLTHTAQVNDVAFNSDSTQLATATADGLAQIWQVGSWQPGMSFKGHKAAVNSVSFSPDGTELVTASLDHDARIWDVTTGATVRVLEGHAGSVTGAAFSADGRWVATAGPRTAGIWSATAPDLPNSTDRLFFVSDGHQRIETVAFGPRNWLLATAAANGSISTYTCALCAGTSELVRLANERLALLKTP
jgi:WD40 repeat protein